MQILRTANAGVLLTFDGVRILLDGICGEIPPYLATPQNIKLELCEALPDIVAFTHFHTDHFDKNFALLFEQKTGRRIISPENSGPQRVGGSRDNNGRNPPYRKNGYRAYKLYNKGLKNHLVYGRCFTAHP